MVGLLTPYFPFFDDRFPASFRARQESYAGSFGKRLARFGFDVRHPGLLDSEAAADRAGEVLAAAEVDVLVVAPTMACPPTHALPAIERVAGKPVIICQDQRSAAADGYSELAATEYSNLLGCVMIGNALRRADRRFVVIACGAERTERPLAAAICGAAAAASLRGLRIAKLGDAISGYLDVEVDAATADALGLSWEEISVEGLTDAVLAVDDRQLADVSERLAQAGLSVRASREDAASLSLRLCAALSKATDQMSAAALTVNCHGPALRQNERIGICGCLAASLLSGEGFPVACTGDAATTFSLMVAARLGGRAQYCEGYLLEPESGDLLLGSCGLGDPRLATGASPARVQPNDVYPGVRGEGYSLRMGFPAGPATIVSFTPVGPGRRPTLVAGYGALSGRSFPDMVGPNGTFRYSGDPVASVVRWNQVAPAHHVALTSRHIHEELRTFCEFAGLGLVEIGEPLLGQ